MELQGRGLGADPGRHADHHERRHGGAVHRSRDPEGGGRITVRDAHGPVDRLNELEYVKGRSSPTSDDRPHRADLAEGRPRHRLDRSTGLMSAAERGTTDAVLNGIAYDAAGDRLFVTGKLWPRVFEIKLVKR